MNATTRHLPHGVMLGSALTTLFMLPLSFQGTFFTTPKLFFLAGWVMVLTALATLNRQKLEWTMPRPLSWLLVIYALWITASNLGLSPYRAFTLLGWGDWQTGLLFALLLPSVFILATLRPRAPATVPGIDVTGSGNILLPVSAAILGLSVLERLGFNPLVGSRWFRIPGLPDVIETTYPLATIGNPGWIAGFWLLVLPLPLLLRSRPWAALWQAAIALGIASTGNKASLYLGVGWLVFLLIFSFVRHALARWRLLLAGSLLLLLTGSALLTWGNERLYAAGLSPTLRKTAATGSAAGSSSLANRFTIWQTTLNLVAERPLTGWGLDTLHLNFFRALPESKYQTFMRRELSLKPGETIRRADDAHLIYGPGGRFSRMVTYDVVKPHNALIQEMYSHGLPGLLLVVLLLFCAVQTVVCSGGFTEKVLLASVILYGIYLLVWFTTLAVTPLAAVLLGFAVAGSEQNRLKGSPAD